MNKVRFEKKGVVGRIMLRDLPGNALSREFTDDLLAAVHEASASNIRALVIRTDGLDFGIGGDVPEWPGKDANGFRTFIPRSIRPKPPSKLCVSRPSRPSAVQRSAGTTVVPLTSVARPHHRMVYRAADLLLSVLGGHEPKERHVLLEPELVVRVSTALPLAG